MFEDRKAIMKKLIEKVTSSYDVDGEVDEHTNVAALIDSLDTMNYIFFLEEEFGVKISDEQVAEENILEVGKSADLIISLQR